MANADSGTLRIVRHWSPIPSENSTRAWFRGIQHCAVCSRRSDLHVALDNIRAKLRRAGDVDRRPALLLVRRKKGG